MAKPWVLTHEQERVLRGMFDYCERGSIPARTRQATLDVLKRYGFVRETVTDNTEEARKRRWVISSTLHNFYLTTVGRRVAERLSRNG